MKYRLGSELTVHLSSGCCVLNWQNCQASSLVLNSEKLVSLLLTSFCCKHWLSFRGLESKKHITFNWQPKVVCGELNRLIINVAWAGNREWGELTEQFKTSSTTSSYKRWHFIPPVTSKCITNYFKRKDFKVKAFGAKRPVSAAYLSFQHCDRFFSNHEQMP